MILRSLLLMVFFLFTAQALAQEELTASSNESYSNEEVKKDKTLDEFKDVAGRSVNDFAKDSPSLFHAKRPTPSRFFAADLSMPDSFATTNNLAKKTGSFYRAFGEIIFVQGTITDSFNVPIAGAVVEIWQTNAAGKYHTLLEQGSEYIDKYFSMSGRTITDNLGNYHFITIMPGSRMGRAPHINMNIYHQKFGRLETEMYFQDHPYNDSDYQYLVYNKEDRALLTSRVSHSNIFDTKSIKVCTFNITMRGVHQFKRF
jgi:protocatechuate 3,4-dioxygenase beta subunit